MRPLTHFALPLLAVATVAFGCSDGGEDDQATAPAPQPTVSGTVTAASGLPVIEMRFEDARVQAEIADDGRERATGLSNRESLPDNAGMLFVFQQPETPSFWMRETLIPLDLVWIDENKRVVAITPEVQPEPGVSLSQLKRYSPPQPVLYVLELNAGAAERLSIDPGEPVEFEL